MTESILIVQPDPAQARRLHQLLLDLGHSSEMLGTGTEALERLKSGAAPDLLITELSLPGPDGLTLVAELRKRRTAKQAAAVIITSYPGLLAQALRLRESLGIEAALSSKAAALTLNAVFQKALQGKGGEAAAVSSPTAALLGPTGAFDKLAREKQSRRLRRIAAVSLAADLPLDEALPKLVADVASAFEMPGALVQLNAVLQGRCALHWTGKGVAPPAAAPEWSFLAPRQAGDQLRPLLVPDTRLSATMKSQPLVQAGWVGGFATVVLTASDGAVVGALSLIDQKPRYLDADELELLGALAQRVGGEILASARLHEMREDLTSQWQTAMEREDRLEMLKGVLETLHLGVLLNDSQGKVVLANSRLAEISGMERGQLQRLDAASFHQALLGLFDDPDAYLAARPAVDQGPFSADLTVETQRPRRQVLRWTAKPVHGGHEWYQLNLWEDLTAEVDLQAERARLVTLDPLTELLNRRGAEEELEREAERARRKQRHYTLLRMRLHHLQDVNRLQGHEEGDLALQAVGVCLRRCLRLLDRPARWGGRQFLVLLPETPEADGRMVAGRIRDAVAGLELGYPLAVSLGVAGSEDHANAGACLAAAEARLAQAVAQGPGTIL